MTFPGSDLPGSDLPDSDPPHSDLADSHARAPSSDLDDDRILALELVRATEAAAMAASRF